MPTRIRLQRFGAKKKPFYFIVVADSRAPRDGKSIEKIGTYNPLTVPATISVDRDKAIQWMEKGAQPSPTVSRILSFKGVLYYKHLLRGVKLGLFDKAAADAKFDKWLVEHELFVSKQKDSSSKAKPAPKADKPIENKPIEQTEEKTA